MVLISFVSKFFVSRYREREIIREVFGCPPDVSRSYFGHFGVSVHIVAEF